MNTPATAARWEGRRLLGAFVALIGLCIGLMPLVASANPPDQIIPNPPPTNQAWTPPADYARYPFLAGVWDATCEVSTGSVDFEFDAQVLYKVFAGPRPGSNQGMLNQFNSGAGLNQDSLAQGSYVAYAQAKNTAVNQQLVNLPPGWPWWHGYVQNHPNGWIKYVEFQIGMDCIPTTTTTEPETTTTTEPTTTTTEPETTTTTEPTTTTTEPETTTTTEPETTTTTEPETPTTTVPETTTTTDEVEPTIVTSTTSPDPELPLTGAFADTAAWVAMVLIALGLLMVTATRRTDKA